MERVHRTVKVGPGNRVVVPVTWEEGIPFALKLEERWHPEMPAHPERVRYLELDLGIPDPRDAREDGGRPQGDCRIRFMYDDSDEED